MRSLLGSSSLLPRLPGDLTGSPCHSIFPRLLSGLAPASDLHTGATFYCVFFSFFGYAHVGSWAAPCPQLCVSTSCCRSPQGQGGAQACKGVSHDLVALESLSAPNSYSASNQILISASTCCWVEQFATLDQDVTVQACAQGVDHKASHGVDSQDLVAKEMWGLHISWLGFWCLLRRRTLLLGRAGLLLLSLQVPKQPAQPPCD